MPKVDLVYDRLCPNVEAARTNLMRAISRAGVAATWEEHQIGDPEAAKRVRGYGSPTILVDGIDVAGMPPDGESACRLYGPGRGAPDAEMIAEALARARGGRRRARAPEGRPDGRWRSTAAVLPGLGVALMPKVVCPLCLPALAGLLSAAGLAFLMEDRWLLPITALLLAAALLALGWRARARRGYGPLAVGSGASTAILAGKFALDSPLTAYLGVSVLVAACVWNAWPLRPARTCRSCRRPELRINHSHK